MNTRMSRRRFLAGATAGVTILPSARMVFGYQANEQLRLAVFGTMYNASHMLLAPHIYGTPIIALCDPDQRKTSQAFKRWKESAARLVNAEDPGEREWGERYRRMSQGEDIHLYSDIRRMLDEMDDSIDALVVSHYDHLHGVSCGPALSAGKPVLSERPLGLNISDARRLRTLAAESGLPTTYRSPGTATGPFRRAMELVEDGAIGPVREVHVWFKRGGPDRDSVPQGREPIPATLNWDAWLGPLPWRDYHSDWMAYAHWRETCSGGLGTFGPHTTIFPFMTLKLRRLWSQPSRQARIRVTAECSRLNRISFPRWERVKWEFPSRGDMPPLTMTWHHGPDFAPDTRALIHGKLNEFGVVTPDEADALMQNAGSLLIGGEGAFVANDHSVQVTALPHAKFEKIETDRPLRIPPSHNIYRDWIDACRGKDTHIIASFDNGGPLSELLMLGNIATLFPEETLSYDPLQGCITNQEEANQHLGIEYRKGWKI
ncbi:MAG: Gfo/Idh/MocA family protein [Planctomycetota bacterium]